MDSNGDTQIEEVILTIRTHFRKMALARLFGKRNNRFNIKSYSIRSYGVLGQGAFGVVFKGKDAKKNPIAAKRIDGNQHADVLTHRYDVLLQLDHPNIIKILEVEKMENIFWMFMEFCESGDLNKFYRNKDVTAEVSEEVMRQIMYGIIYLHGKDIIHRDVKPGNILVASEDPFVVKLTDFDVSKCLDPEIETSAMSSNVGTNAFKAPEFFVRNELKKIRYHCNVDIYAAGLTFLAILQHKKASKMLIPHIETPGDDSELHIPIGQLIAERIKYKPTHNLDIVSLDNDECTSSVPETLDSWNRNLKKLIQKMTVRHPQQRLAASSVVTDLKRVIMFILIWANNFREFNF